ncbi:polysaccharide deacetylase family protein [Kaistia dalseonensis]|uniref:Chitooligosaccharide deacetylase n=1 Tax=Kaistia dalseonensis TaxID=410840 RepID=A0ABU0H0E5_9HYPH|nr:polysaccharide deacetylase family protein [Kaistia dalseonensis]MCX5493197.1 polysaccharide deacetylase family protein [Kaistia dalseonensis]MDQ0435752.1 peptidoglycan/xylan/chitin deacetylase (PgdA/CDA1 family) [Kaistia dalseonensis]
MKRSLLALFALLLVPASAYADPPAACWPAASLAGSAAEKASRRAGPADAVAMPVPLALPVAAAGAGPAGVVRRVNLPKGEKLVALTFDLCEAGREVAGYDGGVVDTLRAQQTPATFFMGGRWAQSHADRAMQLLVDPLFEVGDHTYDHANLDHADAAKVADEIGKTEAVLNAMRERATQMCPAATAPAPSRLFRFPYGSCSPESLAAVSALGQTPIQWDVVSGDPSGIAAAPMAKAVLAEVKPGSIIVMHANGRGKHTAEALQTIIPKLKAAGYRFVTVSDLIAAGKPQTAAACYIEHPGDTARYDAAAKKAKTKGADIVPAPVSQGVY